MTEKRYYEKNYDEEYYIFDSKTLTEKEFDEKVEYDGYDVFSDSLTPEEVLDLLNENEELKQENHDIKHTIKELYYTYIYKPSEHYDEDSCDKIIGGILKGVENYEDG